MTGRRPAACAACAAPKPAIPVPRIAIFVIPNSSFATVQMRTPPVDGRRQSRFERELWLPTNVLRRAPAIAEDQRGIVGTRRQRANLQQIAATRYFAQQ